MRYVCCLVLFYSCLSAYGQQFIQGKILDSETREPLAFVNISIASKLHGTTTGIDGNFKLHANAGDSLIISYVGYESVGIKATGEDLLVLLQQQVKQLSEVEVLAGENPADAIIRRAVANADKNDPENLPSFRYNAYHKLFAATAGEFDTLEKQEPIARFFDEHYLFLNETYSRREFIRSRYDKETIEGNRMSGVKDPFFAVPGNQFQSFSFYKPHIRLLNQEFVNPLLPGTFGRYEFTLEDSRIADGDTTYVISFTPIPGKTFNALKGIMSVSSNGYAIENIQAQPADEASLVLIRIQQKYSFIDGHWFPQELHSEFILKEQKVSEHPIKYVHQTYIRNVRFNESHQIPAKDLLKLEFAANANRRGEYFWSQVRVDSLTARELNTYRLYDSMPVRTLATLNTFVKVAEAVATGRIKAGRFYLPTDKLIRSNGYEGLRPGVGIQTGEMISKLITAETFFAFGLSDNALKYGAALQLNTGLHGSHLKFSFLQDILEVGNSHFLKPPPSTVSSLPVRQWLATRMDSVVRVKAEYNFRPLRFTQTSLFAQRSNHIPTYELPSETTELSNQDFTLSEIGIQVRFIAGETYSQIRNTSVISGFRYPHFDISVLKAVETAFDGDFGFTKVESRFHYAFNWNNSHKTVFEVAGGLIRGNAPYSSLFNGRGSNAGKFDLNSFAVANYFQTMKVYEFTSDRYAYMFFTHHFGRIFSTRSKYFRPELSVHQNVGYGSLRDSDDRMPQLQTFQKGFFESGFTLTNLARINYVNLGYIGIGGGLFYRYGSYRYNEPESNLVGKINLTFSL